MGRPLGGSSPEPASYPLGGHEQMAVSVKPRWEDPGSARAGWIALGWCFREGPRRGKQIDGPIATRAGGSSAPIATVDRSFRRPGDAFEHPHSLGG